MPEDCKMGMMKSDVKYEDKEQESLQTLNYKIHAKLIVTRGMNIKF